MEKKAKCLMIQGTSSNAGKSVMVAALCRIYSRLGYKVAPFKSQNMSLNSYTTKNDEEIAIAQAFQAESAGIEPTVHMNPVLLKPKEDYISQVIVHGKVVRDMDFKEYQNEFRETALNAIKYSLEKLKSENDIVIIEGAGSPAEINMRDKDLANMEIAHLADSNVVLVADIDKGGVFAAIAGTFALLSDEDVSRLKAVVINKFRGDLSILAPGIKQVEDIIKSPIIGVIPYDYSLKLPEEDSASLAQKEYDKESKITIGVLYLPRIANFTDIDPLEYEEDVGIKMVDLNDNLDELDALIIPGTRSPINDLKKIKDTGMYEKIIKVSKEIPIIGICGGYQILGNNISSDKESHEGLSLLDVETSLSNPEKIVKQSNGEIISKDFFGSDIRNCQITGYEIHEGITTLKNVKPLINVKKGCGNTIEGLFDGAKNGNIIGSYFHGIFQNFEFRRSFTDYLRIEKKIEPLGFKNDSYTENKEYSIDKLAEIISENIDMEIIDKLIFED